MSATFFRDRDRVMVDVAMVDQLRVQALASPRRRARLCLHAGPEDAVQEMLLAVAAGAWIPPHRQLGKEKSYLVLEGELAVAWFAGEALDHVVRVGAGGTFLYRFPASAWHTVAVLEGVAVYLETVAGPFRAEGTEFAPWAPGSDDPAGAGWLAELAGRIRRGG